MTAPLRDARTVLAERARQLARPLADSAAVGVEGLSSLLVARLGDERVGIALDHVTEVHRASELTPIPGARPPVVGVIAWRGRVLTVLDVAHSRRELLAITDTTRILVIGQRTAAFGIIADDVEDVHDVDINGVVGIEDASPARREFIRGVTADALVVLDATALIARFAPPHQSTGGPRE